jgi:P pilus assembly chaperone PapD
MAMQTLPADVRPAKIAHPTSSLTKSTARAVDNARLHLRTGNPGAYARSLAGEHRAANARQQRAIEAVIASDSQEQLFIRHPANGCLLAKEC